ncbi:MAG: hypothetical protein N3A66_01395 [Planctomycetota bacterium]|nr:hypothetical protein [Planctomycetota bacterium]
MGEDEFVFETYGGKVVVEATEDAMTPFGGLVPWAAFQKRTGIFERLAATCPVKRTSPNAAPVYDILVSLAALLHNFICDIFSPGYLMLCYGDRVRHSERRHDI